MMLAKLKRYALKTMKPAGYSTFFFALFSLFLVNTLPLERFIPNVEDLMAEATGRKVTIGDLGTSITGGFVFSDVEISAGKTKDGKNPKSDGSPGTKKSKPAATPGYQIEELKIDFGMLSLLFNTLSIDAVASALGGEISISYSGPMPAKTAAEKEPPAKQPKKRKLRKGRRKGADAPPDETPEEPEDAPTEEEEKEEEPVSLKVALEDVILKRIVDLNDILPVPIDGNINLTVDLHSESGLGAAAGVIEFSITDATLSRKDYEADLSGTSLKVPKLEIESIEGEITFEEGVGTVTKFEVRSKHIDIGLAGTLTLHNIPSRSQHDLYWTFKVLKPYLAKSDAIKIFMQNADSISRQMKNAHRDDDFYGFRYRGVLGKGRFTPTKEFSVAGTKGKTTKEKTKKKKRKRPKRKTSRTRGASPRTPSRPEPPARTDVGAGPGITPGPPDPGFPPTQGPGSGARPDDFGRDRFPPGRRFGTQPPSGEEEENDAVEVEEEAVQEEEEEPTPEEGEGEEGEQEEGEGEEGEQEEGEQEESEQEEGEEAEQEEAEEE